MSPWGSGMSPLKPCKIFYVQCHIGLSDCNISRFDKYDVIKPHQKSIIVRNIHHNYYEFKTDTFCTVSSISVF